MIIEAIKKEIDRAAGGMVARIRLLVEAAPK